MVTYREIQQAVKTEANFVPKTCWIADVLAAHGKTKRQAPNRISENDRVYPCPSDKREAIERTLKRLKVI